jgi:hypothetical protein
MVEGRKMSEEELKEKMSKDLKEIFDAKTITNFILDLVHNAYLRGMETGMKISDSEKR